MLGLYLLIPIKHLRPVSAHSFSIAGRRNCMHRWDRICIQPRKRFFFLTSKIRSSSAPPLDNIERGERSYYSLFEPLVSRILSEKDGLSKTSLLFFSVLRVKKHV